MDLMTLALANIMHIMVEREKEVHEIQTQVSMALKQTVYCPKNTNITFVSKERTNHQLHQTQSTIQHCSKNSKVTQTNAHQL